MTIYINDKEYKDGTFFRIAVESEFRALSLGDSLNDRRQIISSPVGFLQHGMILLSEGKEERIEKIYVKPRDTRAQFYFMHIYKTSGLSINTEIRKRFAMQNVYNNFIGLVDDEQMINSSLITGHFASYPIDLFKQNNLKLHSFTIIRNPIDRVISHYLYENKIKNPGTTPSVENMYRFININTSVIKDLQSKNITSSMDTGMSNYVSRSLLSGKTDLGNVFSTFGANSRFIEKDTKEDQWQDHIDKFSLIGTMDNRDLFMRKLDSLLQSELYTGPAFENSHVNKNLVSTNEFKKSLPKDLIDLIISLNQNDLALYDMLLSKGM
jgi:hypothetical protein